MKQMRGISFIKNYTDSRAHDFEKKKKSIKYNINRAK